MIDRVCEFIFDLKTCASEENIWMDSPSMYALYLIPHLFVVIGPFLL